MTAGSRDAKRRRGTIYLAATAIVGLLLVGILIALKPLGSPLDWGIRALAMGGYLAIFLAVISSAFMRELFKLLGRPFIKGHHILSLTGLGMVTLHPLGAALRSARLSVFLPDFSSISAFLDLGGRPAWYLLGAAALAAALRSKIKRTWRSIHYVNYVAFLLATVHAVRIGTDFTSPAMKAVPIAMALVVAVIFVRKRIQRSRLTRRS